MDPVFLRASVRLPRRWAEASTATSAQSRRACRAAVGKWGLLRVGRPNTWTVTFPLGRNENKWPHHWKNMFWGEQDSWSGLERKNSFFKKKKRNCIYLFMAALGLHGCKGVFSSCSELASHGGGSSCCRVDSRASGLGSCGAWSSLLRGMWDLHGPGIVGNRIAGDCRSIYAHTHTAHL